MARPPKEPNAVCVGCGAKFVRSPSGRVIRCAKCRRGMRGMSVGYKRKNYVCPVCGGKKAAVSAVCATCYHTAIADVLASRTPPTAA